MAEKIGYLDGLRGIAALVVVIHHYFCAFYPVLVFGASAGLIYHIGPIENWIAASPLNVFYNGGFAVCIFFVLSGYVLSNKFFNSGERKAIISSAVRRYIRLAIPVLFAVVVAYVLLIFGLYFCHAASNVTGSPWLDTINGYDIPDFFSMLKNGLWSVFFETPNISFDNALWTMAIEFAGSFLVFGFVMLFGNLRNRWVFYVGAALVFVNTYYLAFIVGMLLSDLYNIKNGEKYILKNPVLKSELFLLGLFFGSYNLGGWWGIQAYDSLSRLFHISLVDPSMFFRILGSGIVLLVLLNSEILKNMLNSKVPLILGKISFTMYLLHLLVLYSFSSLLFLALIKLFSYNTTVFIVIVVSLPVVLCFAYLTYVFIDEPGIRFSKHIYEQYFADISMPIERISVEKKAIAFIKKNIVSLVVAVILLTVFIGGMVYVAKPHTGQNNADIAASYYDDELDNTISAYNDLMDYPAFNDTTVGAYRVWLDGYEVKAHSFYREYESLKMSGQLNQQYFNSSMKDKIANDISLYGDLANESENKTDVYEMAYQSWYWNNIPVK